MLDELDVAESLLRSALERYSSACSAVEYYCRENALGSAASDRIVRGLALHDTFTTALMKAKISLRYSRNASRYILPINNLPSEILVHILSLATTFSHETCKLHDTPYCSNRIHLQPIGFASVCVRWRSLILQYPTLWSRIDIVHIHELARRSIPRAKLRLEHSGPSPLDIRVAVKSYEPIVQVSLKFLTSLANRSLGSLSFMLQGVDDYKEDAFFKTYFSTWAPGTLRKLVLEKTKPLSSYSRLMKSIGDSAHQQNPQTYLLIDLPHEHPESLWRPITILRLHGIYIDWGSQAYHGLVELSLLSNREGHVKLATISESQSSFTLAEGDSIVPVRLNDLQVLDLDLDRRTENSLQYILRWVSPGSNPLKLLLPRSYGTVLKTDLITRNRTEIHNFLMRSKVVELCLYTRTLTLDWLFSSAPHLQTLAVWFNSSPETLNDEDRSETDNSMLHGTINKLYILASTLRIDTLCQGLSRCPQIQSLVFWRCAFVTEEGGAYAADMFIKHPELLDICSEIENISDRPSPIGGWRAPPHGYTYSI